MKKDIEYLKELKRMHSIAIIKKALRATAGLWVILQSLILSVTVPGAFAAESATAAVQTRESLIPAQTLENVQASGVDSPLPFNRELASTMIEDSPLSAIHGEIPMTNLSGAVIHEGNPRVNSNPVGIDSMVKNPVDGMYTLLDGRTFSQTSADGGDIEGVQYSDLHSIFTFSSECPEVPVKGVSCDLRFLNNHLNPGKHVKIGTYKNQVSLAGGFVRTEEYDLYGKKVFSQSGKPIEKNICYAVGGRTGTGMRMDQCPGSSPANLICSGADCSEARFNVARRLAGKGIIIDAALITGTKYACQDGTVNCPTYVWTRTEQQSAS